MSKCIVCDNQALPTAAVCEWHLHNPSNSSATDNKPTSLQDILHNFGITYNVLAKEERKRDIDKAIASINALIPEKSRQAEIADKNNITLDEMIDVAVRKTRNATIDQIHANFTGQTDNEGED